MPSTRRHVRLLASVTGEAEAELAAAAGADIIDCKDPATGALGALPGDVVRRVRERVPTTVPVSATIGDMPAVPEEVFDASLRMAATGADYIKIGFFPGGDARATIRALSMLAQGEARLVGLLLADREPDLSLIEDMGRAGFSGVMLDTAGKSSGALPDVMSREALRGFIEAAHEVGLFAGLAGSLRVEHIPGMLALEPDLLGFRGALCAGGKRTGPLDAASIATVRRAIPGSTADATRSTPTVGTAL